MCATIPDANQAVPGSADLAPRSRTRAAADERGRRAGPLRAGIRPRRGADAVQHVPPLYGGRASDPRGGQCRRHRARRAQGRASARQRHHQAHQIARGALLRDPAARYRQGPARRSFSDVGAAIAASLCPRLGLSAADTAAVAWLVQEPSGDERHGAAARRFRSQDGARFRRAGAVAGDAAPAADADRGRYPRRRARRVERLEGPAAARALLRSREHDDRRRPGAARAAASPRPRRRWTARLADFTPEQRETRARRAITTITGWPSTTDEQERHARADRQGRCQGRAC